MNIPFLGGPASPGDLVTTQPFKFTSAAAYGGGILSIAAVITEVVNASAGLDLPAYALAVVIAAGLIAAAMAAAADVIARAWVQTHVPPPPKAAKHVELAGFDLSTENGDLRVRTEDGDFRIHRETRVSVSP